MSDLHVHFLGFGPPCPSYAKLGTTPGSDYTEAINSMVDHGALAGLGFQDALRGLAATITADVDIQALRSNVPKNLYGL